MKKVLIIGPIGDFGGRELEVGFIAHALRPTYDVTICSTGNVSNTSQVYHFNTKQKVVTLNQLVYKKYIGLKLLAHLSFLKNFNKALTVVNLTNNKLAKRFLNYNKKRLIVLKDLIYQFDAVFICAQLSSSLISEIIAISKAFHKPILFRTTGTIRNNMVSDSAIFKKIDVFIHHSINNASNFENYYFKHSYVLIDQCAFNEIDLLKVPLKERKIKKFIVLSRLSIEKQVDIVIKAFDAVSEEGDCLYIYGDGEEKENLKILKFKSTIIFKGFVKQSDLPTIFNESDCLIVSSLDEAGPLTGLEAMASGVLTISTRVGAMEERLENDCFWYNGTQEDLEARFKEVKKLSSKEVHELSKKVRERYLKSYRIATIERKYLEVVDAYIK
ncbi:glycosyltransferase family 4 protein [Lutibacter sp.]|uniref:glycosyltransferase family 4 protein n=1 Tax=Lutibacter sp. TaxID=1925666 RepID=UPI001A1EEE17|nr:glycosyltransferase family 4 protein [Lutibacter sp.]MBI9042250.1 glycosyltransferase family 4 protein [Lutibacter sp.]